MDSKTILCFLTAVSLLTAGCGAEKATEIKPPLVKTECATYTGGGIETYSGQIKGRREANLSFQVGGEIEARLVEVGSFVSAGDVLMRINPRDVRQKLTQAQAQLTSAQAQMELSRVNLARYEELFAADAAPKSVLDQYRADYRARRAAYDSAVAAVNEAQNSLGYTELVAPADGIITQIRAEAGQVTAAGSPVITLMQTDEMEAEVYVPENRLAIAPVGTEVRVAFWANAAEVAGTVREVSPVADATRTYRLRITPESIPTGTEAGMTVNVTFNNGGDNTAELLLPLSAIFQADNNPKVWVVQEGKITAKPVQITAYRGNKVTVSGITPKDHVVVSGVGKLRDGQAVREELSAEVAAK